MLIAVDQLLRPSTEWVLICETEGQATTLGPLLRKSATTDTTLICRSNEQTTKSELLTRALAGKVPVDGQPTLYQCENFSCQVPLIGEDCIRQALANASPAIWPADR
jgi:uncharacterized protein YyaL (SSP411 family)